VGGNPGIHARNRESRWYRITMRRGVKQTAPRRDVTTLLTNPRQHVPSRNFISPMPTMSKCSRNRHPNADSRSGEKPAHGAEFSVIGCRFHDHSCELCSQIAKRSAATRYVMSSGGLTKNESVHCNAGMTPLLSAGSRCCLCREAAEILIALRSMSRKIARLFV